MTASTSSDYDRTIAVIGGTGLAAGVNTLLDQPVEHHNVEVAFGEQRATVLYYLEGIKHRTRVIILPRHGPTLDVPDRSPAMLVQEQGYEAHCWLFHTLGVSAVYAFSAVGAVDLDVPLAGELAFVVPDNFGRGLAATTHSFGRLALNVHPNMGEPFCPTLRGHLIQATEASGATALSTGTYIYNGPDQFETAAEIRAVINLYPDEANRLVGMTAGPEVALAKQMQIPYAVLCANANYAQGLVAAEVDHHAALKNMGAATEKLLEIAARVIEIAAAD